MPVEPQRGDRFSRGWALRRGHCARGRRTHWQAHGKRRPVPFAALDGDRATMQAHQLLHQRQADAGPLLRARPDALHLVEAFEDARLLVRGNTDARVANLELHSLAVLRMPHHHADPAFERVVERVARPG